MCVYVLRLISTEKGTCHFSLSASLAICVQTHMVLCGVDRIYKYWGDDEGPWGGACFSIQVAVFRKHLSPRSFIVNTKEASPKGFCRGVPEQMESFTLPPCCKAWLCYSRQTQSVPQWDPWAERWDLTSGFMVKSTRQQGHCTETTLSFGLLPLAIICSISSSSPSVGAGLWDLHPAGPLLHPSGPEAEEASDACQRR